MYLLHKTHSHPSFLCTQTRLSHRIVSLGGRGYSLEAQAKDIHTKLSCPRVIPCEARLTIQRASPDVYVGFLIRTFR